MAAEDRALEQWLREVLSELLVTHSPSGCEREMDEACLRLLGEVGFEGRRDAHGNIIAEAGQGDCTVLLLAHKDEIGAMVARVFEDGKMELEPLGGAYPWVYGEGPFDVLGREVVTGVLALGSKHVSEQSGDVHRAKREVALKWPMMRLDCKLSREELQSKGIGVGARACVARSRKQPLWMGDYVAGYGLDDKAGVAAVLGVLRMIRESAPPVRAVAVFTDREEVGTLGSCYAARQLGADVAVAVDVAPVAPEYDIKAGPVPVVIFKDTYTIYDAELSELMCECVERVCGEVQRMVVRSYGSDAAGAYRAGYVARPVLLGLATENTHGCEVVHVGAVANAARSLVEFLGRLPEALG